MVDLLTKIIIEAEKYNVVKYASAPDNEALWYKKIKLVDWKEGKPLPIGLNIAFVAHFLVRKLVCTYGFYVYDEGDTHVVETVQDPFPMRTTYLWAHLGPNKTEMSIRNIDLLTGFSKLFSTFMVKKYEKGKQKDLESIKLILENKN